ncbi:MAG: metallophosphatase family protein [Actinomycetota bacterium]|nr:metallophosphatase family protein [Actinomycetota bacterium]
MNESDVGGPLRVAVISDTHSPRFWTSCPPSVAAHLENVDLILHAGDVCTVDVLRELQQFAPVHAVLGNNDGTDIAAWGAPETLRMELAGVKVAMIHDSGPATGRLGRMRRAFPDADLVIFGHSHIPMDQESEGLRIFNPGSPTDKRRQPEGTIGLLELHEGRIVSAVIVPVARAPYRR